MLQSSTGGYLNSLATLGDRAPVLPNSNYYGSAAIQLSGMWSAYSAIYKSQIWVNVLVSKLARAHARLPFGFWFVDANGGRTRESGPLDDLMRRPNPECSGFDLWIWFSSTYDLYGEAYLVKLRDRDDTVRELWRLHPENVLVRRNTAGELEYVYTAGRLSADGFLVIPARDIIAARSYNPDNVERGLSPIEPLRMTLLNEDASRRATASFWRRGARPGMHLTVQGTLSDPALQRLKQQIDANHSGADNVGGTLVLEEGATPHVMQLNLEEMQYIESRKLGREEVCAVYDVPPPVVHILDRATFSNITEQLRSLYRDTMAPRNEMFESIIDHQLVPDFYAPGEVESRFDMDEVLRGDFETRATAVGTLIEKGVYKPSEARPLFGLPPAGPEADQLFANAALIPLGSAVQRQPVATDGTLMPQPVVREVEWLRTHKPSAPNVRSIMGRLSRLKDASTTAIRERLIAEHATELRAFFAEQKAAAIGDDLDAAAWDEQLASILVTLSVATTKAVGGAIAKDLGGKYDEGRIADWLEEEAKTSAANLNATTAAEVTKRRALAAEDPDVDLVDELDNLFDVEVEARTDEISISRVAMLAGLASLVAADQAGAKTKTWVTTSANPRESHAAVNGETVGLEETFSNGMTGPGDVKGGGPDEVAGCTCELQFNL